MIPCIFPLFFVDSMPRGGALCSLRLCGENLALPPEETALSWHWHPGEQLKIGVYITKWTFLAGIVGVLSGSASAIFLVSLDYATKVRVEHRWLLYLLPLAGLAIGLFYRYLGRGLDGGNNLILEEIHDPQSKIPARLAPVILIATVATHLFGGSAGREGTAVQMGGSLASWLARLLRLDLLDLRILVMAGVSGGFGSVFGTPVAGMIFGLEVLAVGRMRYDALIPCLIGSAVGHWTCLFWFAFWGGAHGEYAIHSNVEITALLIAKILLAAPLFGLASILFSELTHALQAVFARIASWPPARPLIGGVVIVLLTLLVGTNDYLGLSLPLLHRPFDGEPVRNFDFAWKLLFTAVTLGAGFKGGEVTPLFVIGATLGATLDSGWACRSTFSRLSASSPSSPPRPTRRSPAPPWGSSSSARRMPCRSRSPASARTCGPAIAASTCRSVSIPRRGTSSSSAAIRQSAASAKGP